MIAGQIEIQLMANIARLQRDMDRANRVVGDATARMGRAADAVKASLAGIAAGIGLSQIAGMVDEYTKFTAQLRLATLSQREYAAAYSDVKRIANQSTQGLGETGVLYAKIANGTRELGIAQKQVAAITETVNLSLLVSGATASESASAQLQLAQAFASGTLRGEEFNAVNEAAPRLMKALADGMGLPVGALKKMAEEGKITSGIMAEVLPDALERLREEAKEIQTISGAFTVLKSNVMEFVGTQAQASGAVSFLTGAIGLLANNLGLLAGAIATFAVAKIVTMFTGWVAATRKQIAENAALRASTLATAVSASEAAAATAAAKLAETQANVRASASAVALANARVAELRAAVLAADGAVALAVATNGLIPAQARAIALAEAHAVALAQQAVAGNAATVTANAHTGALAAQATATGLAARAAGVLRGVMAAFGGPLGFIITLLGAAATAWMVFGKKAEDSNKQAAESYEEAHTRIVKGLDEQIAKNEKLLKLKNLGMTKTQIERDLPVIEQMAAASERLSNINTKSGEFTARSSYELMQDRAAVMANIAELSEKMRKNQVTADAVAAQSTQERVAGLMKEHATKQEQMAADLKAIEDLRGKTELYDTLVARIRAKYAEKSSGAGDSLERERALMAEVLGVNADYMEQLTMLSRIRDKGNVSEERYVELVTELIGKQPGVKKAEEERARAAEQLAAFEKSYGDALSVTANLLAERVKDVETEAAQNEELVRTFGMTKAAIEAAELARLEEQLAQKYSLGLTLDEIEYLEKLIATKKRSAAAIAKVEDLEKQKDLWTSIEKTAHDTFVSIADGGKNAAQRLRDTFKNIFFDWLYQQTLKKWIIQLQPSTVGGGGLLESAGNAFNSSGGGLSGLLQAGRTIYQGFSKNFASTFGGLVSKMGETFGSKAMQSFGANMSSGAGAAGSAGPIAGAIVAGMMANNKFFDEGWRMDGQMGEIIRSQLQSMFRGNGFAPITAIMTASMGTFDKLLQGLGVNAKLASMVSGSAVFARAFGHKAPSIEAQGIQGTIGTGGFTGEAFADILRKGGWFRSDKRSTTTQALDIAQERAFDETIKSVVDSVRGMGAMLGLEASRIDGYSKQIKITLTDNEEENKKLIEAAFGGLADDLASMMLPSLAQFTASGETASVTLQRLATGFAAVTAMLDVLSVTSQQAFGAVGIQSLEARERLVSLAGGLDSFVAQADFFAQNFLTEAQRLEPVQKRVTEQLAALGYAGLATTEDFGAAVLKLAQSGALATEAGAATYAGLLALAPAFKQVADAAKQAQTSLADTLRSTVGAAFEALDSSINARKAELQKAFDDVMSKFDARIQASNDRISSLQSLRSALGGAVDGMGVQGELARQQAQAQIGAALAIAKASGILPSAGSLEGALRAVQQDAGNQFSSLVDFQRDQLRTANQIEELAGLTDVQLSVEERTLQSMVDQKALLQASFAAEILRLDGILASAQFQLDAINGNTTAILGLSAALKQFAAAAGAAVGNSSIGSQASVIAETRIEGLYNSLLGRGSDADGLKFWSDALRGGVSMFEIEKGFRESPEYQMLQATANARAASATSGEGSALLAELQTLNRRMEGVERSTKQFADQFDNVSAGGNALLTEAAT